MTGPFLQVALDLTEIRRALQIGREAVEGGADWIEAGTPLIKSEGMNAVRELKAEFPGHEIVADMKIADTGALEVEMAAKAGATIVCVLADSDDSVIMEAVRAADKYGVRIMADLINTQETAERAVELEKMGVHILNAHVGIDQQMKGIKPIERLREIADKTSIPVCAAGGLDAAGAAEVVTAGAEIVIVGSTITKSADVKAAAKEVRDAIDSPGTVRVLKKDPDEEIRGIFESVSTPNISDAMHRKGAMTGIFSVCGDVKMVGRAVTVRTMPGDWAKPVEAIDVAKTGEVIVINAGGATYISPWGELATLSCINKGIAGVVIDGAARDIDDIRKYHYPVFATALVPNAGEPKGFGEIGAEIDCCGRTVRSGDWVVGDESGVVVVPKERAYEIARRALEVRKNENRIREEIRRGDTLSGVMDLLRWEKR